MAGGPPGAQGGGNGHKGSELKLRMPEQLEAGVYANSMVVQHTIDEFILDFAMIAGPRGTIVARVITSPGHMKKVIAALEENMRKYEAFRGKAEAPGSGE
jgi:hypothetical protein